MTSANHGFRVLENEWIALSDGTRLAARIWLPDETYSAPVPAILEYLPYKKRGGSDPRDEVTYPYFAQNGYAGIRVDIRGNGESDGLMEDEYTPQELEDGKEVIAWIARQDWCDGNVGIIGISWGGFNGLQIAALRPPALKAVITACSTDDRYADDIHFMGGCLLNDNLTWSAQMMNYSSRPPDPDLLGDEWRKVWLERLETLPLLAANWLQHQRRDAFWKHGSVCEDYGAIEVPVLAVGGWHDAYTNAIPRMLDGLGDQAKGIIGPWEHKYPNIARVGPAIDFLGECIRWWDCWLKGEANGADAAPALRAYLMQNGAPNPMNGTRDGVWVAEQSWPPSLTSEHAFHLAPGKLLEESRGIEPIEISSPQDIGLMSGNFCPGMRVDHELPGDQRTDDDKSILFDSAPLKEDLAILGAPELEFEFSSSADHGMLVARLCEVGPDGASLRVSLNPLNLTHLTSHETPEALEPEKTYRAKIKLSDAGHVFQKGNRIRLALSTSYWPLIWPSPEETIVTLVPGRAVLTLPAYQLHAAETAMFAPAPEQPESTAQELRPASDDRQISQSADGTVTLTFTDDMGHSRHKKNGLETSSRVTHSYWIKPDDPLSARAQAAWSFETRRGDWRVTTQSSSTMTCDAQNFHLKAKLIAFENSEPVFERTWEETIRRDHV